MGLMLFPLHHLEVLYHFLYQAEKLKQADREATDLKTICTTLLTTFDQLLPRAFFLLWECLSSEVHNCLHFILAAGESPGIQQEAEGTK